MPVTLDFDPNAIYSQIQKSTDVAVKSVADKVVKDTERFVPKSPEKHKGSGTLRRSATVSPHPKRSGFTLTYERPIQRKDGSVFDGAPELYEGINPRTGRPVQHWNTENTGEHWLDRSIEENYQDWIDYFKKETRRIWNNRPSKKK